MRWWNNICKRWRAVANPLLALASAAARWLPAPVKRGLYRLGPLSRRLRGALNRSAPKGLTEVKVAAGLLAGATLLLDLQNEKDYWLGTYEVELQQAIRDWVKPGMTAYDLGANVGYISLMLASRIGARGNVVAFEPLPTNIERLRANLALNPDMHVEIVPKAVADRNGIQTFHVHASDDMGKLQSSAGRKTESAGSVQVETISLDDFIYAEKNPAPELIKIDIEGGEGLALAAMTRLLNEARPLLLIELHGPDAARETWEALLSANYRVHSLKKNCPRINALKELGWKAYVLGRPAA